jgi:SAM-dependent methyltransferase
MIETIEFKGHVYPAFQASGNAARFVREFAKEVCKGKGLDIGPMKAEWVFPGSTGIDKDFNDPWEAMNLPKPPHGWDVSEKWDFIHSSHCLEHLPHWATALNYWHTMLKDGGVVFLYLPDHSQVYWRTHHNFKHIHALTPEIIKAYFTDQPQMWKNVFVSGVDLNNSFIAIAEKI